MALFGKKKNKGAEDAAPMTPAEEPVQEEAAEMKEAAPPKLKVRPDVYTLLLGLSVAALLIASILLYLNIGEYGSSPLSGIPKA